MANAFVVVVPTHTGINNINSIINSSHRRTIPIHNYQPRRRRHRRRSHPSMSSLSFLRATSTTTSTTNSATTIPRISSQDLQTLQQKGYVVVTDFLTSSSQNNLPEALRNDMRMLRQQHKFKSAKIGQDSTNTLNNDIRVAETCFIGKDKPELRDVYNPCRDDTLYQILEGLRVDLEQSTNNLKLDTQLTEFLYAYYPQGGFYRRHRDAVKGSASWLRQYSLLLYLNTDDYDGDPAQDGGRLRLHFDSGGDFLPPNEAAKYVDIDAAGGTLVLFESSKFPHEVLDSKSERFAVVGWYNRPMSISDLSAITSSNSGGGNGSVASLTDDPVRLFALAVAAGLVTVGLINILAQ